MSFRFWEKYDDAQALRDLAAGLRSTKITALREAVERARVDASNPTAVISPEQAKLLQTYGGGGVKSGGWT